MWTEINLYIGSYFILINLITFLVFGIDKYKAIKRRYRISEKMLFMLSIIGGAIGAFLGMFFFRHKTRKWYFKFGIPFILLVQILVFMAGIRLRSLF